ncbi:MAG: hypothetical protein LBU27_05045 [Candidatus Peribacteria bacterium]|jgi:hypothetical protein|nr:hypothetical protein [Candidatus Peribacteria bacterium]
MLKTKLPLISLALLLGTSAFSRANYEIKLNTTDKKVYITSGATQISLENVADYFSGTIANTGSEPTNQPAFSGSVLKELES